MAQFDFAAVKNEVIANVGTLVTETAKNELLGWFEHTALPSLISVAEFAVEKTLTVLEASVKEAEKPEEAPVETVTIA